jgi:hypothetical protein
MQIEDLFGWMDLSRFTVIGYDFRSEAIKDELISKLPSLKLEIVDSSFSLRAEIVREIRERKSDFLLEGKEYAIPRFAVIDMTAFRLNMDNYAKMSSFAERIRQEATEMNMPAIVIKPVNSSSPGFESDDQISIGPSQLMYVADLAITITEVKHYRTRSSRIKVLKNRYSHHDQKMNVSLEEAKDFKYISTHETS